MHSPVAKLRAPQTRHCILQVLAEVKDILHGPLPLGFRVCGSAMQNRRFIKHLECQNKAEYMHLFYSNLCMPIRETHTCMQSHVSLPHVSVLAVIIVVWTDVTGVFLVSKQPTCVHIIR